MEGIRGKLAEFTGTFPDWSSLNIDDLLWKSAAVRNLFYLTAVLTRRQCGENNFYSFSFVMTPVGYGTGLAVDDYFIFCAARLD
ncbi:unnamed protein product [Prunus armeniaca]|uniref:Uncharacterized protein n=1 Tax=Prunus armeniaca TaxID=36596 RepID=A0A6J5UUM0_PRUAR|nr:unnamed protein product [Prunus armeniaca]CAB4310057.1 unnamed protein product [Prunus armeniaca]